MVLFTVSLLTLKIRTLPLHINHLFTRTLWLKVHLYLALSVGFLFALIGLTGSLCVYQEELDSFLNPELTITNPPAQYQSLDKIMDAVRAEHPQRSGTWTLEMPRTGNGVITAWFEKPRETFFEAYAPLMVSINPYTAEIIKTRFWGKTFSTWLLNLHSQLLMDSSGSDIVGVLGVLLSISVCTGLYLWWPGIKDIRSVFQLRANSGIRLLLFDCHRWIGLTSALAILTLALTGILLSYPALLETLFGAAGMEHGQTGRSINSTAQPNNHPTGLAGAAFIARAPFPHAKLRRVTTPLGETGIYRINLRQAEEVNQKHPYTTVWIDRWSGQIREVRDPNKFSFGETLSTWIWPLHTGEALGSSGRLIWFIAGQAIFMLYISGLALWLFRTGRLKDKKINYADCRIYIDNLKKHFIRLSLVLFRFLKHLVIRSQRYTPLLHKGYIKLQRWLEKHWHYP